MRIRKRDITKLMFIRRDPSSNNTCMDIPLDDRDAIDTFKDHLNWAIFTRIYKIIKNVHKIRYIVDCPTWTVFFEIEGVKDGEKVVIFGIYNNWMHKMIGNPVIDRM